MYADAGVLVNLKAEPGVYEHVFNTTHALGKCAQQKFAVRKWHIRNRRLQSELPASAAVLARRVRRAGNPTGALCALWVYWVVVARNMHAVEARRFYTALYATCALPRSNTVLVRNPI